MCHTGYLSSVFSSQVFVFVSVARATETADYRVEVDTPLRGY